MPKTRLSDTSSVSKEQVRLRKRSFKSEYEIDLWKEVRRRWLVLGVLLSILGAMVAPRAGATGGKQLHDHRIFHADYLVHIPLCYIYYRAGRRARRPPTRTREGGQDPPQTKPYSDENHAQSSLNNSDLNNDFHSININSHSQSNIKSRSPTKLSNIPLQLSNPLFKNTSLSQNENQSNVTNNALWESEKSHQSKALVGGSEGSVRGSQGSVRGSKAPSFWKLVISVVLHTRIVCPALCALTVEAFKGAGVDYRVIKGLLISSSGAGCPWLPLSLAARARRDVLAILISWLTTPLWMPVVDLVICGHIIIPPIAGIVKSVLTILIPFIFGLINVEFYTSFFLQRFNKYKESRKFTKDNNNFAKVSNKNSYHVDFEQYNGNINVFDDYCNGNTEMNMNKQRPDDLISNNENERSYLIAKYSSFNKQSTNNNKENIKENYKVNINSSGKKTNKNGNMDFSIIDRTSNVIVMGPDNIDVKVHVSMLLVLYVEVCDRVSEAEETLYVGDVLLCLVLVCVWVSACVAGAALVGAPPLAAAQPAGGAASLSVRCGPVSALPSAIALPALALLAAAREAGDSGMYTDVGERSENII